MLATAIPAIIAFPVLALYTWLVVPEEYGIYVAVMAAATFVQASIFEWLWAAALRLSHGRRSEQFLAAMLVCFIGIVAVGIVVAIVVALMFHVPPLIAVLAFSVFAATCWLEFNQAILRAGLEVGLFARLSVMRSLATHFVSLSLVLLGLGVNGLLIGAVAGPLIPGLWIARPTWSKVRLKNVTRADVRKILAFGLPLVPGFSIAQLISSIDRLVLALLKPAAGLGVYGAAAGMTKRAFTSILEPLGNASFSLAVHAHEGGNQEGAFWRISSNLLMVLAVGAPAAVGLALVAGDLAASVFGPAYRQEAALLLPITGTTYLCYGLRSHFTEQIFYLAQRSAAYSTTMAVVAAVSIPTHFVLIWYFGILGAAWAMLITQLLGLLAGFFVGIRFLPLRLPYAEIARVAVATVLMTAVVWAIPAEGTLRSLAIRILAGVIVYAAVVLAFNIRDVRTRVWSLLLDLTGRRSAEPPVDTGGT